MGNENNQTGRPIEAAGRWVSFQTNLFQITFGTTIRKPRFLL